MGDLKSGPGATDQVTDEISRLMVVMQGEMTRNELQYCLGLEHSPHFRNAYLNPALNAGFIEMTIPEKPNSRLQRYRLTTRGKNLIGHFR